MATTPDGGVIAAGLYGQISSSVAAKVNIGHGNDGWLVKVNAKGEQEWSSVFSKPGNNEYSDIAVTQDGGFIVTGKTENGADATGRILYDGWLVKVNAKGEQEWSRTFGGSQDDKFSAVAVASDGGFVLAGATESSYANVKVRLYDGWLVKVNASGAKQWVKTFGGSGDEEFSALTATDDGNYVIAGPSVIALGNSLVAAGSIQEDYDGDDASEPEESMNVSGLKEGIYGWMIGLDY